MDLGRVTPFDNLPLSLSHLNPLLPSSSPEEATTTYFYVSCTRRWLYRASSASAYNPRISFPIILAFDLEIKSTEACAGVGQQKVDDDSTCFTFRISLGVTTSQ